MTQIKDPWKVKLGIVVPSWNTVMEYEFQRLADASISVHAQRIKHTDDSEASLNWLSTQAVGAATLLSHAKVRAICHGCTASGFLKTPDEDLALAAEVEQVTGIPCVTSSASIVKALRALGAKTISVASPYEAWLNERVAQHLKQAGFEIAAISGLGTQSHGSISTQSVLALARSVVRPDSQAIFISCSNFRTLEIIEQLEHETGLPVITSNQAAFWGTLRRIGVVDKVPRAGKIFQYSSVD